MAVDVKRTWRAYLACMYSCNRYQKKHLIRSFICNSVNISNHDYVLTFVLRWKITPTYSQISQLSPWKTTFILKSVNCWEKMRTLNLLKA